jgi:hypothetical protein
MSKRQNMAGLPRFSRKEIEDLTRIILGQDNIAPSSPCCECGRTLDRATSEGSPRAGDISLCGYCGSLNAFDEDLRHRKPTDEEYFAAAVDRKIQNLRQMINRAEKRQTNAGKK